MTFKLMFIVASLNFKALTTLAWTPPSFISSWVPIQSDSQINSDKTIAHGFGTLPAKVDVQIRVTKNGKDYIFTGIGTAQRDDDDCVDYGGVVYYYDSNNVYLALPYDSDNNCNSNTRGVAYTGPESRYNGPSELRGIYTTGSARVRAWRTTDLPTPLFDFDVYVSGTSDCFKSQNHGSSEMPDLVVAQVEFSCDSTTCVSEAQGNIAQERTTIYHNVMSGVLLGFDETVVKLWVPSQSDGDSNYNGYVFAAKDGWGNQDRLQSSANVRVRGYKLDVAYRTEFPAGREIISPGTVSFGQSFSIDNDLVIVQVRQDPNDDGDNDGMIFSGVGSSVTSESGVKFSGVVYAYTNDSAHLYTIRAESDGYMIFIDDRWDCGEEADTSDEETADVIVTVFSNVCPTPADVANAAYVMSSSGIDGQVVYTCDTGFTHDTGDMVRTCLGMTWDGTLPTCKEIVCEDPSVKNSTYSTTIGFKVNSLVTYSCNVGYVYKSGHLTRSCQTSGLWSGTPPSCLLIDCLNPGSIANGSYTYTALSVGSTVTYVCDPGYGYQAGDLTRTCQFGGTWSGVPPVCSAKRCTDPGPVINATYTLTGLSPTDTATYSCSPGNTLIAGSSIRTCQADETWSGTPIICITQVTPATSCFDPGPVSNAAYTPGPKTVGSTVTYSCLTGYSHVTGDLIRTCQSNRTWDGVPPVCLGCTVPETISNATYTYDGLTIGSTVTYTCDSGYYLVTGQLSRKCMRGGFWDGIPPVCSARRCSDPGPITNATYSLTGLSPSDTATYVCDSGNIQKGGDSVRTCQADESWSGTPIICIVQTTCSVVHHTVVYTPETLAEAIEKTKQELTVDKKETNSFVRSLTSAKDPRPSSTYIGTAGVVLLCSIVVALIVPDIFTFVQHIKIYSSIYNRLTSTENKNDQ